MIFHAISAHGQSLFIHENSHQTKRTLIFPTPLQHLMYSFKSFVRDFSVVILILLNIGLNSLLTLSKMINLLTSAAAQTVSSKCLSSIHAAFGPLSFG